MAMNSFKKLIMMANQIDDKPSLPKEYVQLEYLKATGTQYIDLGYPLGYNNKVVVDVYPRNTGAVTNYIFGNTTNTAKGFTIDLRNYDLAVHRFNGTSKSVKGYREDRYTIVSDKQGIQFKDDFYPWTSSPSDFTTEGNVYLCAVRNASGVAQSFYKVQIYSCQIYENDVLIHDYIPALCKADSKPGMYDLVSGQFFVNQGKGEFTYG